MFRRPSPSEIPDAPGVYLFRDEHGSVLYVGKAKSLRKRLANYFGSDVRGKTAMMVDTAAGIEWIVTPSEVAAIMTEFSLVQEHQPRFNIRLRDDKSFPYLALTVSQEWPRAVVVRGKRRKGTQYFGPYAHAYAIRQTLDLMLRTFPIRTCTDAKLRRHETIGRPCLLFHIEKCAGPCVGEIDANRYQELVDGMAAFFDGDSAAVANRLTEEMEAAAAAQQYEERGADPGSAERSCKCDGTTGAGHGSAGRLRRGCGGRGRVGGGARRAARAARPDHGPQVDGG